jgi:hypothetical protein
MYYMGTSTVCTASFDKLIYKYRGDVYFGLLLLIVGMTIYLLTLFLLTIVQLKSQVILSDLAPHV